MISNRVKKFNNIGVLVLSAFFVVSVIALWFVFSIKDVTEINDSELDNKEQVLTRSVPDGSSLYENEEFNFSLIYPQGLNVKEFDEKNGSWTIVFDDTAQTKGFQIFLLPYSEEEITKERLQIDVAGSGIEEPLEVFVGEEENIRALVFWSEDPFIGRLRELWFIHDGYLYEITTPAELDLWLAGIMKTWRFESAN